jgi:hypothetical protein
MKYAVQREDGTLLEICGKKVGFNTKEEAVEWFREHCRLLGGLDWSVGFYFKARGDQSPLRIVWSRSLKELKW